MSDTAKETMIAVRAATPWPSRRVRISWRFLLCLIGKGVAALTEIGLSHKVAHKGCIDNCPMLRLCNQTQSLPAQFDIRKLRLHPLPLAAKNMANQQAFPRRRPQ